MFAKPRAVSQLIKQSLRLPSQTGMLGVQSRSYKRVLDDLPTRVKEAQYAVRGAIPIRGEEIKNEIRKGHTAQFEFKETTQLNIGNPQAVGQGIITYNREVLAAMMLPSLRSPESTAISEDAKRRAIDMQAKCVSPPGAYTGNSKGWTHVRQCVSDFINQRDGLTKESDLSVADEIYLTNGASEGVRLCLSAVIRGSMDGVIVPIPQYPLYSAQLTLNDGKLLPYYLDEENGWSLNVEQLEETILDSIKMGIVPRAIVVINPGNPTGQVMKRACLERIIRLCHEHSILIMADEVYQQNIYKEGAEFISMRKVMAEMGEPYANSVELISMNSISKGVLAECGLRGGYIETRNLSQSAQEILYKLKSIELCSNTAGQIATCLLVDPPKLGRESPDCVAQYEAERNHVFKGLTERAHLLTEAFNDMDQVTCTEIEGAMYGFPRLHFSQKFIDECLKRGVQPDFQYCLEMVNSTGIMTVPGSGFGQVEGTYHFRITNLVNPTEKMRQVLENLKVFNDKFMATH